MLRLSLLLAVIILALDVWQGRRTALRIGVVSAQPTAPINDDCSSALEVFPSSEEEQDVAPITTLVGTVAGASGTSGPFLCHRSSSGVWYKMIGNGKGYHIRTNVPSHLEVISSTTTNPTANIFAAAANGVDYDNNSLVCLTTSGTRDGNLLFPTIDGVTYYIRLSLEDYNPYDDNSNNNNNGEFTLTATYFETVSNDQCQNAVEIQIQEPTNFVRGSTAQATSDGFPLCDGLVEPLPGVWYTFVGTGKRFEITTCSEETSFDTRVSVFKNSCSNEERVCVDGTFHDDPRCPNNPMASAVTIDTKVGEQYWILVYGGCYSQGGCRQPPPGNFGLYLNELEAPDNDQCNTAIPIQVNGPSIQGDTSEASLDDHDLNNNNVTCTKLLVGHTEAAQHGVWYRVDAAGAINNSSSSSNYVVLRASTCGSTSPFRSAISVYRGDKSCKSLVCVAIGTDSAFEGCKTTATWSVPITDLFSSDNDTRPYYYYIAVHEYPYADSYQLGGTFTLSVTSVDDPPPNDQCPNATKVLPTAATQTDTSPHNDNVILGSTASASVNLIDYDGCFCRGPGVWYETMGTGGRMVASTCYYGMYWMNSKLLLFSGSCDDETEDDEEGLVCLSQSRGGTYDDCENWRGSNLEWDSQEGTSYKVLICPRDHDYDVGRYAFSILTLPAPENNQCETAHEVVVGEKYRATTIGASADVDMPTCEANSNRGVSGSSVWFRLAKVSGGVRVRTCTQKNPDVFRPRIAIFKGSSCSNLQCLAANQDSGACPWEVSWAAMEDEVYSIIVHSWENSGDFELEVESIEADRPGNDICSEAMELPTDCSKVAGSSKFATYDDFGDSYPCGSGIEGVWYKITGTGRGVEVFAEQQSSDEPVDHVRVYSGSCENLRCVSKPSRFEPPVHDPNYQGTRASWISEAGTDYYIHVRGTKFRIHASEFDSHVINDVCKDAIGPLCLGEYVYEESTIDATPDFYKCPEETICYQPSSPGVWLYAKGTGGTLIATTCTTSTDYDTVISVLSGECDNLEYIGGHDGARNGGGGGQGCELNWDASTFEWETDLDKEYYILVSGGWWGNRGTFGLSIREAAPPSPDSPCIDGEVNCSQLRTKSSTSFCLEPDAFHSMFEVPAALSSTPGERDYECVASDGKRSHPKRLLKSIGIWMLTIIWNLSL